MSNDPDGRAELVNEKIILGVRGSFTMSRPCARQMLLPTHGRSASRWKLTWKGKERENPFMDFVRTAQQISDLGPGW